MGNKKKKAKRANPASAPVRPVKRRVMPRIGYGRLFLWGIITIMLVVLVKQGCAKTHGVKISTAADDGVVFVLTDFSPEGTTGFTYGGGETIAVGSLVTDGGDSIKSRALYRFDISDWSKGDITFHGICVGREGSPGDLETYLVKDFGVLPDTQAGAHYDISTTWNLAEGATMAGEASPEEGKGFSVKISASTVEENKTSDNYLCFMIKTSAETEAPTNTYTLTCYESGDNKPYVSWKA